MKIAVGPLTHPVEEKVVVFDGEDVPVAVILTDKDRENIANMAPGATIYCVFPDDVPVPVIQQWLDVLKARE